VWMKRNGDATTTILMGYGMLRPMCIRLVLTMLVVALSICDNVTAAQVPKTCSQTVMLTNLTRENFDPALSADGNRLLHGAGATLPVRGR